jgi:HK97 family phage major capsid protein
MGPVSSLKQAGLALGKSPRTLRRWIARGAPTAGSLGRGHGAQVDIAALQRWRSPPAAMNREQLEQFAEQLRAFYRSGGHRHAGMRDEAARLYSARYGSTSRSSTGTRPGRTRGRYSVTAFAMMVGMRARQALNEYADRQLALQAEGLHRLAVARLGAGREEGPRLNLARLILDLADPAGRGDPQNRELLQDYARRAGQHYDSDRPLIPFTAFRDLIVASGSGGGFLHGAETRDAIDILRPWSVTARAGVMIETGLVGDQAIPKVTAKATPEWLGTEASEMTPSQPTLAQVVMTPKQVGALVNFSRQLAKQANAEEFVGRELMRTIGTALDQAVLNGSGAAGQPLGLLNTAGVQSQSGTTLNAGVQTMKRLCAEANVDDARIVFLSTPAVRELLEGRERSSPSGRYVWGLDTVADRPAYVSTNMPAATMVAGDWSNIFVGIWGEAFEIQINNFDPAGFRRGTIQARIILSCPFKITSASSIKTGVVKPNFLMFALSATSCRSEC